MLPIVGGDWGVVAGAGVFSVYLVDPSSTTDDASGARAVRLLAA